MTVKDCKPGDATCAEDMDPFLSQESENLLGRVLAGMTCLFVYILLKCRLLFTVLLLPTEYTRLSLSSNYSTQLYVFHNKHSLPSLFFLIILLFWILTFVIITNSHYSYRICFFLVDFFGCQLFMIITKRKRRIMLI
jgi:hypothetical protein